MSSNIFFAHVGLEVGPEAYLDEARAFGFCSGLGIGDPDRALPVAASYVTTPEDDNCAPFTDRAELAQASFGQGRVSVTPVQMALVAATIANDGVMPTPYVVRDVRAHASRPARGPSDQVVETLSPPGGTRVVSSGTAAEVRSAMVDAVEGPLGRLYAGAGRGEQLRGPRRPDRRARPAPPSWVPAASRTPGSSASRRRRARPRRPSRWR